MSKKNSSQPEQLISTTRWLAFVFGVVTFLSVIGLSAVRR